MRKTAKKPSGHDSTLSPVELYRLGRIARWVMDDKIDVAWLSNFVDMSVDEFSRFIFLQGGSIQPEQLESLLVAAEIYAGMTGLNNK